MSKGIFQSGSLGSCEKQSDVFHHIRYANSPRAVVPHKSLDAATPLRTKKDHREAEAKIGKKLREEGFEHFDSQIKKIARVVRIVLFILLYVPYFIALQLPITILRLVFSFALYGFRRFVTPLLNQIGVMIHKGGAQFKKLWDSIPFRYSKSKLLKKKGLEEVKWGGWNWGFLY